MINAPTACPFEYSPLSNLELFQSCLVNQTGSVSFLRDAAFSDDVSISYDGLGVIAREIVHNNVSKN